MFVAESIAGKTGAFIGREETLKGIEAIVNKTV
jgi:F0F1-type ATP synthase beta subunit